jgi:hypothetical protein
MRPHASNARAACRGYGIAAKAVLPCGTPDAMFGSGSCLLGARLSDWEVVMRYLVAFMCVLALGVMPMVGCGETAGVGARASRR